MATCPNKSNPEWRYLEESVGREQAIDRYVKNGNKIPKKGR